MSHWYAKHKTQHGACAILTAALDLHTWLGQVLSDNMLADANMLHP